MHSLIYGDYPPIMRDLVKERLPKFTKEEAILIIDSFDFLGVNYYTAKYAKDNSNEVIPKPSYLTDFCATLTSMCNFKLILLSFYTNHAIICLIICAKSLVKLF